MRKMWIIAMTVAAIGSLQGVPRAWAFDLSAPTPAPEARKAIVEQWNGESQHPYLPADIRAALLKADEAILREDRFDDKAFIMAITKNDEFRSKLEQIANSDRLPENQRRILWNILKSRYDEPTFDIGGLNYDIIWAAFDEERRDTALQRLRGGGPKTALQRLQDLKGANHNEATGADSGKQ